jgi:hypothetical protein
VRAQSESVFFSARTFFFVQVSRPPRIFMKIPPIF